MDSNGLEPDYGYDLINLLDSNGYVQQTNTSGVITAQGKQAVQELRAERADPKIRVGQLRIAMLLVGLGAVLKLREEGSLGPGLRLPVRGHWTQLAVMVAESGL